MSRVPLRIAALALGLAAGPAPAQQGARPPGRPAPEKPAQEKPAQEKPAQEKPAQEKPAQEKPVADKPGAPPVIACPSLANYRLLMRGGTAAAAAALADPRADHLGCAALQGARITGVVERVTLAGRSYDCLGVQGTTACHWAEPGVAAGTPR